MLPWLRFLALFWRLENLRWPWPLFCTFFLAGLWPSKRPGILSCLLSTIPVLHSIAHPHPSRVHARSGSQRLAPVLFPAPFFRCTRGNRTRWWGLKRNEDLFCWATRLTREYLRFVWHRERHACMDSENVCWSRTTSGDVGMTASSRKAPPEKAYSPSPWAYTRRNGVP